MKNVMIIPAKKQVGNIARQQEEKPKLRVAAYCRVSTDTEEQATSYEAQIAHYTEYIQKNPEWEFAGVYADDGISGTNTKKRSEFNRMIEDCEAGNIDMIITKSISRFARNTLDCLKYIRQLKEKNIPVFFEKESINTMDAKGEVLITIMASFAQQESESLSKNVKLGLQFRYQNGQVQVNHNHFLGYTKDDEGNLIIDPEQAEVVKRIYREYLEGYSMDKIAKGLSITLPELFKFNSPIQKTIILNINGEQFILESDTELTMDKKNYIEAICETMYDESNEWYEDIYDMSPYDIAELFEKTVKEEVGITVTFKAIDLEVSILED